MSENGMARPHWRKFGYYGLFAYECSECGYQMEFDGETPQEAEVLFCPHCGVEMGDFIEETGREIVSN